MTRVEIEQIVADRRSGMIYSEIAKKYKISIGWAARICDGVFRDYTERDCVHPNLRRWLNEHEICRKELYHLAGVRGNVATYLIRALLLGDVKRAVDKLVEITGMSYEELFEVEKHG